MVVVLLDDYMVWLDESHLRAALTNEGTQWQTCYYVPGRIRGSKVLLINELAGSGGILSWGVRQQTSATNWCTPPGEFR